MWKIATILAIMMLAACATSPVPPLVAKPGQQFKFQTPSSLADASVVVVRDSGLIGGGCGIDVYINSTEVGTLQPAQKISLWLPPGDYYLTAAIPGHGLCAHLRGSMQLNIARASTTNLRVSISSQGNLEVTYFID